MPVCYIATMELVFNRLPSIHTMLIHTMQLDLLFTVRTRDTCMYHGHGVLLFIIRARMMLIYIPSLTTSVRLFRLAPIMNEIWV